MPEIYENEKQSVIGSAMSIIRARFKVKEIAGQLAAVLSNASGSATGATTGNVSVTTTQGTGDLYIVATTSATKPTASQIMAGLDHLGAAAISDSQAVTSTGSKVFALSGLTASTLYYAHLVHVTSGNSNIITSNAFTTTAVGVFTQPWNAPLRTFYTSKDAKSGNAAGSDAAAGTLANPFATIQRGANALVFAGDELQVREAATPYDEHYKFPGQDLIGIALPTSGTAIDYIHVRNYAGEVPGIRSGVDPTTPAYVSTDLTTSAGTGFAGGFYFTGGGNSDYVHLEGFVVYESFGFGVHSNPAQSSQSPYVEHMYIHDIHGQSGNNVAGVRVDNMIDGHFRNNRISKVFDWGRKITAVTINGAVTEITCEAGHGYDGDTVNVIETAGGIPTLQGTYVATNVSQFVFSVPTITSGIAVGDYTNAGNSITSDHYGLDAGYHGYFPDNCKLYNNDISIVKRGVFQKSPSKTYQDSHEVYWNNFYDIEGAMYSVELQGTGSARAVNPKLHGNIGSNVGSGMHVSVNGCDSQSTGAEQTYNTIHDMVSAAGFVGVTNIVHENNIYHTSSFNDVFATARCFDEFGALLANSIASSNFNTFYLANKQFVLNNNSADAEYRNTLAVWDDAFTNSTLNPPQLTTNPDVNSDTLDPQFTNIGARDFTLQIGSPALTSSSTGGQRGAYGDPNVVTIGVDWAIGEAA